MTEAFKTVKGLLAWRLWCAVEPMLRRSRLWDRATRLLLPTAGDWIYRRERRALSGDPQVK